MALESIREEDIPNDLQGYISFINEQRGGNIMRRRDSAGYNALYSALEMAQLLGKEGEEIFMYARNSLQKQFGANTRGQTGILAENDQLIVLHVSEEIDAENEPIESAA